MGITDEQIAHIERIAESRDGLHAYHGEDVVAIITRLREAEKDAARYRWLRDRGDAYQWENILCFDLDDFMMEDDALDHAIDHAIDTAMQDKNNGQG